jgi:hypothetical protein
MSRSVIALLALLLLTPAVHAEIWAPLEDYVGLCAVIVKAKAVGDVGSNQQEFAIVEVWVGSRDDLLLNDRGNYVTYKGEHGAKAANGQEIVFFFGRERQRKISRHSTAFPIVDGKLVYASTSDFDVEEFTLADFKKRVLAIACKQEVPGRNVECPHG